MLPNGLIKIDQGGTTCYGGKIMHSDFQHLYELIIRNPKMRKPDKIVVKEVLDSLDLEGDVVLADLNSKIVEQLRIETQMAYLAVSYTDSYNRAESDVKRIEANAILSLDDKTETGRKHNAETRQATVNLDDTVTEVRADRDFYRSLHHAIKELARIVSARMAKLEHLNVNYRRELANIEG